MPKRKKIAYAICRKNRLGNTEFLLDAAKLPFYWNRKVAEQREELFTGAWVEPVNVEDLLKFILTNRL